MTSTLLHHRRRIVSSCPTLRWAREAGSRAWSSTDPDPDLHRERGSAAQLSLRDRRFESRPRLVARFALELEAENGPVAVLRIER